MIQRGGFHQGALATIIVVGLFLIAGAGYYFVTEIRPGMLQAKEQREVSDMLKQEQDTVARLLAGTDSKDAEEIRASAASMAKGAVEVLKGSSQMGRSFWAGLCSWGWKGPWSEAERHSAAVMRIGEGANRGGGRMLTPDEQKAWQRVYAIEMLKHYKEFRGWTP